MSGARGAGQPTPPLDGCFAWNGSARSSELVIRHGPIRRGGRRVLAGGCVLAPLPTTIGVVGTNGSGKTSLFLLLAGALDRQRAAVTVDGSPATIAYVPQEPALPPWLGCRRAATMYGLSFDRLSAAHPGLGLDEFADRRTVDLSVGQRQAFAIALALARRATVTLLDEPFAALDFRRREAALEVLADWHTRNPGRALLLSSQNAGDLSAVCDRFLVLRDGGLVFDGSRAELETCDLPHAGDGTDAARPASPRTAAGAGTTEAALLRLLA